MPRLPTVMFWFVVTLTGCTTRPVEPPPDPPTDPPIPDSGRPDAGVDAGPPRAAIGFDPSNVGGRIHEYDFGEDRTCFDLVLDTDAQTIRCGRPGPTSEPLTAQIFTIEQPSREPPEDLVVVYVLGGLDINRGRVEGSRPAILVASGPVTVSAAFSVENGRRSVEALGDGGGGAGSLVSGSTTAVGGGGGASFCSLGGHGSSNSTAAMGGAPGATYGSSTLEPLLLGSTGGDGSHLSRGGVGRAGGAFQLVSGVSISVVGAIVMGQEESWGSSGGSSGGSLLLEAPEVIIDGYLDSGGGDADPANFGGTGSTDGGPGMDGAPGEGGAGGGGAGYIRINTADGTADIAIDALLEPSAGSPCVSFGTLHPRSAPPSMAECDAVSAAPSECERCLGRHCCDELTACRGMELCGFCFDTPPSERGPGCAADASWMSMTACAVGVCDGPCAGVL